MERLQFVNSHASYSYEDYLAFKQNVLEAGTLRKEVRLRDIRPLDWRTLVVEGKKVAVSESAFRDLVKRVVGSRKMTGRFDNIGHPEGQIRFLTMLINSVVPARETVVLGVNPDTKTVVSILPSARSLFSNKLFFDVFERTLNDMPGFEIRKMDYTARDGLSITTVNKYWEFGYQREKFKSGLAFRNDPSGGIFVNPFNERLICTNGMVMHSSSSAISLVENTAPAIREFLNALPKADSLRHYESKLAERIGLLERTPVSVAELSHAHRTVKSYVENFALDKSTSRRRLNSLLPLEMVLSDYKAMGCDLNKMDASCKREARTPLSAWDLINRLTWLASNGRDFLPISGGDAVRLQAYAGHLALEHPFDHLRKVPALYDNIKFESLPVDAEPVLF
ncbi:MAG: hypothetical protein RMM53_03760 [Bacteroidia bacterium]|nr:hypothetical protein [Bacteroidia bacterium]MDW8333312.1 hypothetical protein [Bacteroidia bacterium]